MEKELTDLHRQYTREYIPVTVFMFILFVVGILGNTATIMFYGFKTKRKSSTTVFITILAFIDFIGSLLIGTTIADLFVNVKYSDRIVCRVMFFTDESIIVTSGFILWIISIDRYLKLCRPHGFQFTERSAKISSFVLFLVSVVLAARSFVRYDVVIRNVPFENSTVAAYDCANRKGKSLQTLLTVFHGIDFLTLMIVIGTFIFTYGKIRKRLKEHRKHVLEKEVSRAETMTTDTDLKPDLESYSCSNIEAKDSDTISASENYSRSDHTPYKPRVSRQGTVYRQKSTGEIERNITVMMFAVSVALCFCFLPFVVWNTMIALNPDADSGELKPGIQFVIRSPFWNSVINPIIFCVFNPQFRNYLKSILGIKTSV